MRLIHVPSSNAPYELSKVGKLFIWEEASVPAITILESIRRYVYASGHFGHTLIVPAQLRWGYPMSIIALAVRIEHRVHTALVGDANACLSPD